MLLSCFYKEIRQFSVGLLFKVSDQGFEVKRASKDDIKRFISRYFGHMVEDSIDDVDGERMIKKWIIPD